MSTLYELVRDELARLHRHALICLSCTTCEAGTVFWAFKAIIEEHAAPHLCAVSRHQMLMYGSGLPFGPDCPGLARIAAELHLTTGPDGEPRVAQ